MSGIKSAYELAQERLRKDNPAASYKLTAAQRSELAELDKIYAAKIAAREMALSEQIRGAAFAGDEEKEKTLREQLVKELQELREEKERRKNAIRSAQKS